MADALLAEAERAGARVTVLAVGTWLGQYPQIAERILRGGHDLGNHTMHHLDIAAMEASGAYAEIAGCAERLRALTGSAGRWFRPSQTRYSTPLIVQPGQVEGAVAGGVRGAENDGYGARLVGSAWGCAGRFGACRDGVR